MKVLLVVAYLSMGGVPHIEIHERPDLATCRAEATKIFNTVRAGSTRAWCAKIHGVTG